MDAVTRFSELGVDDRLDREFAAVLVSRDLLAASAGPDAAALRGRVDALRCTGVSVHLVDQRASAVDAIVRLSAAGIGPGLVLIVSGGFAGSEGRPGRGPALLVPEAARCTVVAVDDAAIGLPAEAIHRPGGTRAAIEVFDTVLRRAEHPRVAMVDEDPAWVISEGSADERRRRVSETLLSVAAGGVGTRGSLEEQPPGSTPLVAAAGVYQGDGSDQHLLPLPGWTRIEHVAPVRTDRRVLDLRTGVLLRVQTDPAPLPLRSTRWASAALPGVMVLRVEGSADGLQAGPPLTNTVEVPEDGQVAVTASGAGTAGVAVAARQRTTDLEGLRVVDRMAAYVPSRRGPPSPRSAADLLAAADRRGFARLLRDQRAVWARRWAAVDVCIPDDPETQLAVRYALFQLWSNSAALDELAIGARGLSGAAYAGHVFWDADVFVLPALASIDPAAARAVVRYRAHRLGAARERAKQLGGAGARFPWESAAAGTDVTPTSGRLGADVVPIRTGEQEEHITADVAWGAAFCADWSGSPIRPASAAGRLLVATAQYWQSRCRTDADGRTHIDSVIGPDEYHEDVDDNAFTNVMARWNLRRAAHLMQSVGMSSSAAPWLRLADSLVDGYDPATGRYEQFAGYFDLESLLVADVGTPPLAMDVLLGPRRVAGSQLIKQPDVLMLHHLVPGETARGSLAVNLDFYNPRTAHGSSLSPAVTATLLARAGRPDDALRLLQVALSIDLADLTGTTAGGLHLATLAGVWQCVLSGFAGVRVSGGRLLIEPSLPAGWSSLDVRFRALGRQLRMHITGDRAQVRADGAIAVQTAGQPVLSLSGAGELTVPLKGGS